MASSSSEPAKIEQIITEFFAKSLHIILESRSPPVSSSSRHHIGGGDHQHQQLVLSSSVSSPSSSSSSSSSIRPRDKWFNLALTDCPAALENLDFWRQSNLEPMVVDIVLIQLQTPPPPPTHSPLPNLASKQPHQNRWTERVVERWLVQYETRKTTSSGRRSGSTSSHSLYKKSVILLRSLYLTVRILPAYKLCRDLNSSALLANSNTFSLAHRVSSFVEPFTHREEAEMRQFSFAPVDTSCGRLCLSVLYRSNLSDFSFESLTPMSPQFIPDYVGSPTTDPLKRFPSLPVSHPSPSSIPFARRHSWGSYDIYRASAPSLSPSPSPTYSDSCAFSSNLSSYHPQPTSLPHHPPENPHSCNAYLPHNKDTSFDEYWPSPMFSPSPTPSPPTHLSGNQLSKILLRSESAPVSVPITKLGRILTVTNSHVPPLSPSRGSKYTCSPPTDNARALMRVQHIQTGLTTQKKTSLRKDEVGNLSGAKLSSHSSPRISFSRSSGRFSFQDEFDDSEFTCPFAVDDDDITDQRVGSDSFDGKEALSEPLEMGRLLPVRKSQGAAVGALVRMLRTAPPLGQDSSNSIKHDLWSKGMEESDKGSNSEAALVENASSDFSITASGLLTPKTTSEALEELRNYKEMKDLLLKQGTLSEAVD